MTFVVGRRYLVWRHLETSELLGPVIDFGVPARCVEAVWTEAGWVLA